MSEPLQQMLIPYSSRQLCGGTRWMIHLVSLLCLMLVTTSCGHWADLHADRYKDETSKNKFLSDRHLKKEFLSEQRFLEAERADYKHPSAQYCLALSGGGMRSAAYSIGVLKGLHDSKKLRDVKIISAVSGGSYAATWLYAQQARLGSDNVLSTTSIQAVAKKDLIGLRQAGKGLAIIGSGTDAALLTSPLDLIWGLFRYTGGLIWSHIPPRNESHQTGIGDEYEESLYKLFHYDPNTEKAPSIPNTVKGLSIQAVSKQTGSEGLPYLIVNATVQGVKPPDHPRLANDIFEFTSYGMGSPSVGYRNWDAITSENRGEGISTAETYSLSKIASISGAAVTKNSLPIIRLFGRDIDLGYAMLDPTYINNETKSFLVLTDGGHSENLGVYSLIKRDCPNIIVVDAGVDGKSIWSERLYNRMKEFFTRKASEDLEVGYQFKDYRDLKKRLSETEGKDLKIDALDQVFDHLDDKGRQAKSDTEKSERKWNCWSEPVKTNLTTLFQCSEPINGGYVRSNCKDKTCEPGKQEDVKVTYVKLSADRALLDNSSEEGQAEAKKVYGPLIMGFYKNAGAEFPHYSTTGTTLSWDEDQFLAIAELGCRAVRRHYDPQFRQSGDVCIGQIERVENAENGESNWFKRWYNSIKRFIARKS